MPNQEQASQTDVFGWSDSEDMRKGWFCFGEGSDLRFSLPLRFLSPLLGGMLLEGRRINFVVKTYLLKHGYVSKRQLVSWRARAVLQEHQKKGLYSPQLDFV
jgi:hypothetical protein